MTVPGGLAVLALLGAAVGAGLVGLVAAAAVGLPGDPVLYLVPVVLALGAMVLLVRAGRRGGLPVLAGVLVGIAPALIVAAETPPRHWDDFMTWLPAAEYLYRFGSLPSAEGPPPITAFTGYPPGMQLLIASWSRLAGTFADNAGGVVNVLILAVPAGLLIIAAGAPVGRIRRFAAGAAAGLAVTLGNPGVDWHFVLSALPDVMTATAVMVLAWLGVRLWVASDNTLRAAPGPAFAFGLVLALLLAMRQTGVVLAACLMAALALASVARVGLRTARPWPRGAAAILAAFGPAGAVLAAWRFYIAVLLPSEKTPFWPSIEFGLQPLDDWNWGDMGSTFAAIGRAMLAHWGLTLVLLTVSACGGQWLAGRWQRNSATLVYEADAADPLAAVFLLLWMAYSAFLLFTYLAAFAPDEALRAAEWFRYQSHVAQTGLLVAVLLMIRRVRRCADEGWNRTTALALPLALVASLVLTSVTRSPVRSDLPVLLTATLGDATPGVLPSAVVDALNQTGRRLAAAIGRDAPAEIIIYMGPAPLQAYFQVKYQLWRDDPARAWSVDLLWHDDPTASERLRTAQFVVWIERGCSIVATRRDSDGRIAEIARLPPILPATATPPTCLRPIMSDPAGPPGRVEGE